MRHFGVFLLMVTWLAVGCASVGTVHRPEKKGDFTISSFSKAEVKEFGTISGLEGYQGYASKVRDVLMLNLPPEGLFKKVSSYSEEKPSAGVLVIEGKILRIKTVSRAKRVMVGVMAGRSGIEMEVVLKDKATGGVLGRNVIFVQSSLKGGVFSATDRETINHMAREIIVYLKSLS